MNYGPVLNSYIRRADPGDSTAIHALIVDAFGETYLPYTVYRAPQSVNYLRKLIADAQNSGVQQFYVLYQGVRACGYYHAMLYDRQLFLNYIAVATWARGAGLGRELLNHFEAKGNELDCHEVALDVYGSNRQALEWYDRVGYKVQKVTYCLRLDLQSLATSRRVLSCDRNELRSALVEEGVQGFSKIQCRCGDGRIEVGLIAGSACRLLVSEGVSIEDASASIAARFRKHRDELIILGLSDLPETLPFTHVDRVLRLAKPVL